MPCKGVYISSVILLHETDGITVKSLSASLKHKKRVATNRVCYSALNQK